VGGYILWVPRAHCPLARSSDRRSGLPSLPPTQPATGPDNATKMYNYISRLIRNGVKAGAWIDICLSLCTYYFFTYIYKYIFRAHSSSRKCMQAFGVVQIRCFWWYINGNVTSSLKIVSHLFSIVSHILDAWSTYLRLRGHCYHMCSNH
jgi:hypothetical protein